MVKTSRSTCVQATAMVMVCVVLIFGCSTYKGQKYETIVDKKTVHFEPTGIPYTLARPEYTLTRTPPAEGQKDPTYTLGVTYEPDPSHKYTLKIDPWIFADPTFTVKLATGGTMQATTVTFAEQVTPTITALGSFTASLIGIMAPGLLDKTSLRNTFTKLFVNSEECKVSPSDVPVLCIENLKGPTCLRATPVGSAKNQCPNAIEGNTVGCAIKIRIDTFKSDDEFVELFHYVTEEERLCLNGAKDYYDSKMAAEEEKKGQAWEKSCDSYLNSNPDDKIFTEKLKRAVETNDSEAIKVLGNEIESDKDSSGTLTTRAKARDVLFGNAEPAAEAKLKRDAQKKLEFFLEMDIPTWSGRHLLYLEREIEKTEIFAQRHPQLTASQKEQIGKFISYLRRQRAATIGAIELYDRSIVLSKFLESIKEKTVDRGHAPATSEFVTARSELDAALAQIEARRARVLANAKPAPPPQAPALKKTNLKRVLPEVISASTADGWIINEGKNANDYVLVLKEVE